MENATHNYSTLFAFTHVQLEKIMLESVPFLVQSLFNISSSPVNSDIDTNVLTDSVILIVRWGKKMCSMWERTNM